MADTIDYDRLADAIRRGSSGGNNSGGQPTNSRSMSDLSDKFKSLGGAVTTALDKAGRLSETLEKLSNYGMAFSNNMVELSRSANIARVSLDDYARLMKDNGQYFAGLGGSVSRGTTAFSKFSEALFNNKSATDQLQNMGYTAKELNEILANQIGMQKYTTRNTAAGMTKTTDAAIELATQMDAIAKLTGKSREAQLAEMQKNKMAGDLESKFRLIGLTKGAAEEARARANFNKQFADAAARGQAELFKESFVMGGPRSQEAQAQAAMGGRSGTETVRQAAALGKGDTEAATKHSKMADEYNAANQKSVGFLTVAATNFGAAGNAASKSVEANMSQTDAIEAVKRSHYELSKQELTTAQALEIVKNDILKEQEGKKAVLNEKTNKYEYKKEAGTDITEAYRGGARAIREAGISVEKGLTNIIEKGFGPLATEMTKAADVMKDAAMELGNRLSDANSILNKIADGAGKVLGNAGKEVANTIKQTGDALKTDPIVKDSTGRDAKSRAEGTIGITGKLFEDWGHGPESIMTQEHVMNLATGAHAAGVSGALSKLASFATKGDESKVIDIKSIMGDVQSSVASMMPKTDSNTGGASASKDVSTVIKTTASEAISNAKDIAKNISQVKVINLSELSGKLAQSVTKQNTSESKTTTENSTHTETKKKAFGGKSGNLDPVKEIAVAKEVADAKKTVEIESAKQTITDMASKLSTLKTPAFDAIGKFVTQATDKLNLTGIELGSTILNVSKDIAETNFTQPLDDTYRNLSEAIKAKDDAESVVNEAMSKGLGDEAIKAWEDFAAKSVNLDKLTQDSSTKMVESVSGMGEDILACTNKASEDIKSVSLTPAINTFGQETKEASAESASVISESLPITGSLAAVTPDVSANDKRAAEAKLSAAQENSITLRNEEDRLQQEMMNAIKKRNAAKRGGNEDEIAQADAALAAVKENQQKNKAELKKNANDWINAQKEISASEKQATDKKIEVVKSSSEELTKTVDNSSIKIDDSSKKFTAVTEVLGSTMTTSTPIDSIEQQKKRIEEAENVLRAEHKGMDEVRKEYLNAEKSGDAEENLKKAEEAELKLVEDKQKADTAAFFEGIKNKEKLNKDKIEATKEDIKAATLTDVPEVKKEEPKNDYAAAQKMLQESANQTTSTSTAVPDAEIKKADDVKLRETSNPKITKDSLSLSKSGMPTFVKKAEVLPDKIAEKEKQLKNKEEGGNTIDKEKSKDKPRSTDHSISDVVKQLTLLNNSMRQLIESTNSGNKKIADAASKKTGNVTQ